LKFWSQEKRDRTWKILENLYVDLKGSSESPTDPVVTKKRTFYQDYFIRNLPMNEIENYSSITESSYETDILSWWRGKRDAFPVLSEIARKYLGVSATTVPSESIFSLSGLLSGGRRGKVSPKVLRQLVILKKNYNFVPK